jgi:glycosyltransferase involved in cell wall biosynthesis
MTLKVLTALGGGQVGGAEAFFVTLAASLQQAGVAMRAVLRPSPIHEADFRAAGIPFDHARFGGPLDLATTWKLKAIARDFKPDIVLAFASRANARMAKGDYVLIGRLGGYYKLRHFKRCDYLVCNAPDLVRYCVEGGWPKERVFHIPNYPNLADGEPVSRASLDTPEGAPLALALGRLHPNKALDTLLKAAARVPELYVWIAGEGEQRAMLEALARSLGIEKRVRFLGWRTDRAGLFKAADLVVYPSRKEPFGNVVVEAWGYGVPLVTTASIGPKWLTRPGEDAIVTPIDDEAAFADGIVQVISSPELAAKLAANGRARVAAEFSESAIVRQYLDLFEKVRR